MCSNGHSASHAIKLYRALDFNEINMFVIGFLNEFFNAQRNLAAFTSANPLCGQTGQPACSFAPGSAPGTVPLPIFSRFFATGVSAANGFQNTTFISHLNNNNVGSIASSLAFSNIYRAS